MKNYDLDIISQDLFALFKLFFIHVVKAEERYLKSVLSRSHFEIMFVLYDAKMLSMAEISGHLFMSKPYTTSLVDKLVNEGLAERLPGKNDRRVINITLTEKGKQLLEEHRKSLEDGIRMRVSGLDASDLSRLSELAGELKEIMSKIKLDG